MICDNLVIDASVTLCSRLTRCHGCAALQNEQILDTLTILDLVRT